MRQYLHLTQRERVFKNNLEGMMTNIYLTIVGCGVVALLYGIYATKKVMAFGTGNERMQEIEDA